MADDDYAYAHFEEYALTTVLTKGKVLMHQILGSNSRATSFQFNVTDTKNSGPALPLKEFPEIVETVQNADPKVLREFYKLLYLEDDLNDCEDTQLIQKILEFSGFSVGPGSTEFFIRELKMADMSSDILRSIKKLLCISDTPLISFGQKKTVTFTDLLSFLEKPTKILFMKNKISTKRVTKNIVLKNQPKEPLEIDEPAVTSMMSDPKINPDISKLDKAKSSHPFKNLFNTRTVVVPINGLSKKPTSSKRKASSKSTYVSKESVAQI